MDAAEEEIICDLAQWPEGSRWGANAAIDQSAFSLFWGGDGMEDNTVWLLDTARSIRYSRLSRVELVRMKR